MSAILVFIVIFPMFAAVISYIIGKYNKNLRNYWACVSVFVEFLVSVFVCNKALFYKSHTLFGLGIEFKCGGLRGILIVIAAFVWLMSTLFSNEYFKHYRNRNRYYFFMIITLGATMGVFLSADFYTTLIFFEIMSFTSWVLVMHDETENAIKAGMTYLTVAVIGGLITLMGMFFLYNSTGTLNFEELGEIISQSSYKADYYIYCVMVFVGFGAKAGVFPAHIWLPEAHPVAPAPASALLSCVLTKTGVFGTLVLSTQIFVYDSTWGFFILVLGTITMFLGAFIAVFSINLKRTLACSSLSQIGFILVGIGMQGLLGEHNALASGGTILHVLNHSVIKMTLFLCAGAVYMNLHELDINKIRGWGRDKKLLKLVFLQGLLGIGGIPLWGGYISKTLLHESIVEYIVHLAQHGESTIVFNIIEWVFLISGGLTLAYMTKLFVAVFVEKNEYESDKENEKKYITKTSAIVLIVCAVLISAFGLMPYKIMDNVAYAARAFMNSHQPDHSVHYFAWVNVKGAVISVLIAAFVYIFVIRALLIKKDKNGKSVYINAWPKWLSIEEKIYRPVLLNILPFFGGSIANLMNISFERVFRGVSALAYGICRYVAEPSFDKTVAVITPMTINVCGYAEMSFEVVCKLFENISAIAVNFFDELFEWFRKKAESILSVIMEFCVEPSFEDLYKISYRFFERIAVIFSGLIENLLLWMLIIIVVVSRFIKSTYNYIVQIVLYFLFNYEEIAYDGKRQFRKDAYFSRFSIDKHGENEGGRDSLSMALILFGIGVVAALIYLII